MSTACNKVITLKAMCGISMVELDHLAPVVVGETSIPGQFLGVPGIDHNTYISIDDVFPFMAITYRNSLYER